MGMTEKVLAWMTAVACLLMLARLVVGESRRSHLDRFASRCAKAVRRQALAIYHWRQIRQAKVNAAEEARAAIERARHKVRKAGNVYTPESFKGPKKPH